MHNALHISSHIAHSHDSCRCLKQHATGPWPLGLNFGQQCSRRTSTKVAMEIKIHLYQSHPVGQFGTKMFLRSKTFQWQQRDLSSKMRTNYYLSRFWNLHRWETQAKAIEVVAKPRWKLKVQTLEGTGLCPEKPYFSIDVSKVRKQPRLPAKTVWHASTLSTVRIKRFFQARLFGSASVEAWLQHVTIDSLWAFNATGWNQFLYELNMQRS